MSVPKAAAPASQMQAAQAKRQERNENSNKRALVPAGAEPTAESIDEGRRALAQVLSLLPMLSQQRIATVFTTARALLPQPGLA
eukprot:19091-Amphidinium_carterae.1